MSEAPKCQHVRSNGTRCGSPALKGNLFCYYHQQCRPVTFDYSKCRSDYSSSDVTLPLFDDPHAIQITLHRVTELVLRHQIDQKDASLTLYALQLAMFNLKRVERDQPKPEEIVTDPPPVPHEETEEEWEERHKAVHAAFDKSCPLDPKPAKKPDKKPDDDLPPGTIHACIDTARVPQVLRFPRPGSGRRNTARLSSTFPPFDKPPASATQLDPACDACFGPASNPIELPPLSVTSTPSPPRGPR